MEMSLIESSTPLKYIETTGFEKESDSSSDCSNSTIVALAPCEENSNIRVEADFESTSIQVHKPNKNAGCEKGSVSNDNSNSTSVVLASFKENVQVQEDFGSSEVQEDVIKENANIQSARVYGDIIESVPCESESCCRINTPVIPAPCEENFNIKVQTLSENTVGHENINEITLKNNGSSSTVSNLKGTSINGDGKNSSETLKTQKYIEENRKPTDNHTEINNDKNPVNKSDAYFNNNEDSEMEKELEIAEGMLSLVEVVMQAGEPPRKKRRMALTTVGPPQKGSKVAEPPLKRRKAAKEVLQPHLNRVTQVTASTSKEKAMKNKDQNTSPPARVGNHECIYCQKTFRDRYHLARHQFVHVGEKAPDCKLCKKPRDQCGCEPLQPVLVKQHKCKFCGKTFRDKYHLNRHVFVHTKEKPFKCIFCEKCFSRKDKLTQHALSHP